MFEVADNGCGIEESRLKTLFSECYEVQQDMDTRPSSLCRDRIICLLNDCQGAWRNDHGRKSKKRRRIIPFYDREGRNQS